MIAPSSDQAEKQEGMDWQRVVAHWLETPDNGRIKEHFLWSLGRVAFNCTIYTLNCYALMTRYKLVETETQIIGCIAVVGFFINSCCYLGLLTTLRMYVLIDNILLAWVVSTIGLFGLFQIFILDAEPQSLYYIINISVTAFFFAGNCRCYLKFMASCKLLMVLLKLSLIGACIAFFVAVSYYIIEVNLK